MKSPVLLIIFDRPEQTLKVFESIRIAKPSKLYIAADGPRENTDLEAMDRARHVINLVDWDCRVAQLFHEKNLGCRDAVSTAINWFFSNEKEGIILEDDCLPSETFFQFADEMLEKYRLDMRVGVINGTNFLQESPNKLASYGFSKYVNVWGWASWSNRWNGYYDVNLSCWHLLKESQNFYSLFESKKEANHWLRVFSRVHEKTIDTWDYQWVLANWLQGRINIVPESNLVSNIGFGANATHTIACNNFSNLPRKAMKFPLKHPIWIFRNHAYDLRCDKKVHRISFWKRVKNNLHLPVIKIRILRLIK